MTNLEMVAAELDAAKKKHPKFVDLFATRTAFADSDLECSRIILRCEQRLGNVAFADILQCELDEAFAAYAHGDLAHAKQELAQCAAVCLRAMEYVQNEMEKTKC